MARLAFPISTGLQYQCSINEFGVLSQLVSMPVVMGLIMSCGSLFKKKMLTSLCEPWPCLNDIVIFEMAHSVNLLSERVTLVVWHRWGAGHFTEDIK